MKTKLFFLTFFCTFFSLYADAQSGEKLGNVGNKQEKPNLYILCVGVVNDLQYPKKDAEAIFNTFRTQNGHLFGKVEGELLVCKDNTSRSYIGDKILNLQQMGLRKQDVLLIFLSGHGQTTIINGKLDFGFVGSERSQGVLNDKYLLLSFINDIIEPLNTLPCKRVIFIDACKSGAATGAKGDDFAEIQKQISNTPASIITLSSSSSNESSWESKSWQHGAYTKAMLDGLNGKADINHDTNITIKELSNYIIDEVPNLVSQINQRQQPRLIKPLEFDYPIFNYQNRDNTLSLIEGDCGDKDKNDISPNTKRIAIIGLKPNNLKEFDFQLSNLTKTHIEENQKGEFGFTPFSQAMDVVKKGIAEKLINGASPFIPASLNETEYFLILKREPTTYRQESQSGNQFWVASTSINYYLISTLSKDIVDIGELSVNGADSDKNTAEKRAIERSLESLKIKIN